MNISSSIDIAEAPPWPITVPHFELQQRDQVWRASRVWDLPEGQCRLSAELPRFAFYTLGEDRLHLIDYITVSL